MSGSADAHDPSARFAGTSPSLSRWGGKFLSSLRRPNTFAEDLVEGLRQRRV